ARHPRFGLTALAEKDDVLPAQDRVLDLGDHALVVADDAREERLGPAEARDQVIAHLLLDRLRPVALCLELADRARPHRRSSRARRAGWRSPVWSAMAPPCENPARTIRRAGMPRAVSCSISASTWACEARTPASSSPRRPSRSRTSYQARITAPPLTVTGRGG